MWKVFGNSCGVSDDGCQMWRFTDLVIWVQLGIGVVCGVQRCAGWYILSHFGVVNVCVALH